MTRGSILLNAPSPIEIENVCAVLNSDQPSSVRLRELVRAWQESGPNLQKMLFANQELNRVVRDSLRVGFRPSATGGGELELMIDPGAEYYERLKKHFHRRSPEEGLAALRAEQEAVSLFVSLILNQRWDKLGGPCGRCGRYFVKKHTGQKTYCTINCGHTATAKVAMQRRRQQERLAKLQFARRASRQWKRSLGVEWKKFVSDETGLTVKWLTHAVNQGELRQPRTEPQRSPKK
jgi:hypothetical protein